MKSNLPLTCLADNVCKKICEGCVITVVAEKHGGKTTLILAFLREFIERNTFDKMILVLENWRTEADDSYSWIMDLFNKQGKPKGKELVVYDKFDPLLASMLRAERLRTYKESKRLLFWIDDATAHASKMFYTNDDLISLFVNNRHPPLTIILCLHDLKKVLSPVIRANVSDFNFGKIASHKLLQDIYDCYFGITCKFNDLKQLFLKNIEREYGFITIDTSNKKIDFDILSWGFIAKNIKINEAIKKKSSNSK